ncbi:MAG: hypothetical protein E4H14_13870 [Candidatus Thorarchaeota archaeon]|nr:MAG: hypothetical protein E4H14_13870 [Candidatus Thorarchaeota archaeon]
MNSEGTLLESVLGVGPVIAKTLREHHIVNVEYLARQSYTDLTWSTKLGEATCHKIVTNARELVGYEFQSGIDVERKHIERKIRNMLEEVFSRESSRSEGVEVIDVCC